MQNKDPRQDSVSTVEADEGLQTKTVTNESHEKQPQDAEDGPSQNKVSESASQQSVPDVTETSFVRRVLQSFWQGLVVRQVVHKIVTLLFALAVFSFTYMHMSAHRSVLTYMGVMLLMVLVYAEILVIRDHLWVIEGSMRESRKWRDVFFNQTTLRRQRVRKFLIVLFAMVIFSYIIIKSQGKTHPLFSFMGIILMITVMYYEILTIRDEVSIMLQSLSAKTHENDQTCRSVHEKFLQTASEDDNPAIEPDSSGEIVNNDKKNC